MFLDVTKCRSMSNDSIKRKCDRFLKDKEIDENKYLRWQEYIGKFLTDFGRLYEYKRKEE